MGPMEHLRDLLDAWDALLVAVDHPDLRRERHPVVEDVHHLQTIATKVAMNSCLEEIIGDNGKRDLPIEVRNKVLKSSFLLFREGNVHILNDTQKKDWRKK